MTLRGGRGFAFLFIYSLRSMTPVFNKNLVFLKIYEVKPQLSANHSFCVQV